MNKKVIIIGAGGHGKVVADIVEKSGDTVYGFLDDGCDERSEFLGFPFLGKTDDCEKYINEAEFVIAIGKADIRDKIAQRLKGAKLYTAVHPSAVISSIDVAIGEGTVIMANAVVNSGSRIGRHCIINTGAIVEHDDVVEDFAHISVGAKLAGNVHIGKYTWVGIGAVVSNNLSVCGRCMIRAGAGVVDNITVSGNYQGLPAKIKE